MTELLIRGVAVVLVVWLLWAFLIKPLASAWGDDDCDCGKDH